MGAINRGTRNAFRNPVRALSIIIILSLSIGLALSMLVAHKAVDNRIQSVKNTVGNTVTISPAGVRGFSGGGNPLTTGDINKIKRITHVSSVKTSLNDRLTSDNTSLQSSIEAGALGQRFARNGGSFGAGPDAGRNPDLNSSTFTPPITVIGTTTPTDLADTQGGGSFSLKSGTVFSGNSTDNVALVGTALAGKNNLNVGSTFTAYGQTIKVVGIFESGNTFTNGLLIMPLATVQNLSGQSGDVTSVVATIDSISNVDAATKAISSALGSAADVTNEQQREQDSIAPLENIRTISLYSLIGAVIAGAVIILLTMVMIVRERRREIGVLKAIGASNIKVAGQFMAEAVTFTGLAAMIGIASGVVAADPITKLLVNNSSNTGDRVLQTFPVMRAGGRGFGLVRNNITNIHAQVGWSIILYGLATALIIAIVGSVVASYWISKIRPAEVMRAE